MAYKIFAEEKKYPKDEGYQAETEKDSINLSSFDKWAIETRIKQENRKWVSSQVFKIIIGFAVGLFIAKALNG